MASAREPGEVAADLGKEHLGGAPAHPGNGLQPLQRHLKRAQSLRDLGADPLQTGVKEVDMGQLLGDQEALMRAELPRERLLELGDLLPQPPTCQLRQRRGIAAPTHQRRQDVVPGLAQEVGGD